MLLTSPEIVADAVRTAIAKTGGLGHILNLGHGILRETPVENAAAFVRAAHEFELPATIVRARGETAA